MGHLSEIPPATARWLTLAVVADHAFECFVCRGASPGRLVAVTAGIHGDEYEGPAALWDLARQLNPTDLRGTVMLIPVANPVAFRAGTRTHPHDGKNLARTFPGNLSGSPTERLAAILFELLADADLLIDLHSGGVEYVFAPVAGFYGSAGPGNASFDAASRFGLPMLWQLPPTPGVLSFELHRRGRVVCGCEYAGAGQLSAEGRAAFRAGVSACLAAWNVGSEPVSTSPLPTAFAADWMLAECEGMFEALCHPGKVVAANEPLARITGRRGEVLQEFVAGQTGTILGVRSKASILRENWAVLLGLPLESEHVGPVA
jgi:N-alpha-acetyl-L-2,4-diaminobutyrate deacetylase